MTNGFSISAVAQAYSALPLNITSGVTTLQGTSGRPVLNGAFIERNAGEGSDFFTVNLRVSRTFPVGRRVRVEGMVELFNLTNRRNALTRNANFGPGTYPADPAPGFGEILAVSEPRAAQLGVRLRF